MFSVLVDTAPTDPLARANFGFSDIDIGKALIKMGKAPEAIPVFQEAALTFERMSPVTSRNRYVRTGLAQTYSGLGDTYLAMAQEKRRSSVATHRNWQTARDWYDKSVRLWREKQTRGELDNDERSELQEITSALARCDAFLGNTTAVPKTNLPKSGGE